jgi:hypothetical protein
MSRLVLAAFGLLALSTLCLFGAAGTARANGVPQLVKLTYLDGVSNWGPKDAEGVLEFSFAEAYARIDVKNLKPQTGYSYEGWLTGGAGNPIRVGEITVSTAGVGVLETKLNDLARYDYNTFVVVGRGPAAPASGMPQEKSIAGRFTVIQDNGTPRAGDVSTRPAALPDAGQKASNNTRERLGRTFMVVLVAAGAAVLAIRFIRRERPA